MSDWLEDIVADREKRANIFHQGKALVQGFVRGGQNQKEYKQEQKALSRILAEQEARAPIETAFTPKERRASRNNKVLADMGRRNAQAAEVAATRGMLNRPAPLGRFAEANAAAMNVQHADRIAAALPRLQREEANRIRINERMRNKGLNVPEITPQYAGMLPHEFIEQHGLEVPAHHLPKPPPAPAVAPAATIAPAARGARARRGAPAATVAPAVAPAATVAPAAAVAPGAPAAPADKGARAAKGAPADKPGLFQRYAPTVLGTAGLAAGGYALYNAMNPAEEQTERSSNHMLNARRGELGAMPSMTVTASYEKFAQEKWATSSPMPSSNPMLFASAPAAFAKSLTDTLGAKLVADPIDALHATIKKRFYDEPKWRQNFEDVVKGDPMLSRAHTENPAMLEDAFSSVKRFSPTLAKDRLATRNLLRHVVMSGGEMDHSVMKMLAETEQAVTKSKGR